MSVADFNDVISANLTSGFIGCKEALKVMSKKDLVQLLIFLQLLEKWEMLVKLTIQLQKVD